MGSLDTQRDNPKNKRSGNGDQGNIPPEQPTLVAGQGGEDLVRIRVCHTGTHVCVQIRQAEDKAGEPEIRQAVDDHQDKCHFRLPWVANWG